MKIKRIICSLLCALTVISMIPVYVAADSFDHSSLLSENEWNMLIKINKKRAETGAVPLSVVSSLQNAAGKRADEIAGTGTVSHNRPNGDPWHYVLNDVSYIYNSAKVNEICGLATAEVKPIFDAWCSSQSHYDIMTDNRFVHIGVGYSNSNGRHSWVNVFSECKITGVSMYSTDGTVNMTAGSSIESMGLMLTLTCDHGTSYVPVLDSMVTGYDPYTHGDQTITVTYAGTKLNVKIHNDFSDVRPEAWYYTYIEDAVSLGLFAGMNSISFEPKTPMTRAMFVTVLGKCRGIDTTLYSETPFNDVKAGKWYAPYVAWAARSAIVAGTGDATFSPSNPITRQEICVMIYKFAILEEKNFKDNPDIDYFKDTALISGWAGEAVDFCRRKGLISGNAYGFFEPKTTATRAQCATIIMAYKNAMLIG